MGLVSIVSYYRDSSVLFFNSSGTKNLQHKRTRTSNYNKVKQTVSSHITVRAANIDPQRCPHVV